MTHEEKVQAALGRAAAWAVEGADGTARVRLLTGEQCREARQRGARAQIDTLVAELLSLLASGRVDDAEEVEAEAGVWVLRISRRKPRGG